MARIVYITNGMASTLNSSFELSRRLVSAGHEVTYLSHHDLTEAVEAQGHRFLPLLACRRIRDEFGEFRRTEGKSISLVHMARSAAVAWRLRQRSLTSSEIEDLIDRLLPDLLVIDIEMHYAILATLPLRLPTVLPIVWFSIFRRPAFPPLHTKLLPPRSPWQHVQIEFAWWKMIVARAIGSWTPSFTLKGWKQKILPVDYATVDRQELRALARARGIDFRAATAWTHWLKPHLYPNLRVFSFNAWEMEFPHQPPSSIEYVGPMVLQQRQEVNISSSAMQEWRSFRAACQSHQRHIVYCSLGTFWSENTTNLKRVISVLAGRQGWALVLGLGGKATREELDPGVENILVMEYAPQLEILKSASAAITHGGITTINECIHFAVPMLICSTGHVDQDGCAARVKYHGVGLVADIEAEEPQLLMEKIQQLLTDERLKDNIRRMQSVFTRYEEKGVAVSAIERLLKQ